MKKIFSIILVLFVFSTLDFLGQNGDCGNSVDACTNPSFSITPSGFGLVEEFTSLSNISNPSTNPNATPGNSGCMLSGELNSTWLSVNVTSSGILEFSLGGGVSSNYYDWILWQDNGSGCANISNNSLPPVACNYNGTPNSLTGMASPGNLPAGATQDNFENGINVNAGDQFIICFSNYSNANTNVPLNFFGSATVSCGSVNSPTICYGETATLVAYDGVSFNWDQTVAGFVNTNATGDTAYVNPTVTTDYPVAITMGNGTIQNEIATVTVYPQLTISTVDVIETCLGDNDASITTTVTNGVSPITYHLTGASTVTNTTGVFTNLAPGNYAIDVVDNNGCTAQYNTVIVPGNPCCTMVLTTTQVDNLCFGDCLGSATVDTVGTSGVAPIQWLDASGVPIPGATALTLSSLCAGTYTVEVADPLCTLSKTVTIVEPTDLIFSVNTVDLTCYQNNTGEIMFSAAGGSAPYQYSIDNGVTFQANSTFTGLSADLYNLVVKDGNNCQKTVQVSLTEPSELTANYTILPNICNVVNGTCTGEIDVVPNAGTAPYTYSWTGLSATSSHLNAVCAGFYEVTVTDAFSCSFVLSSIEVVEPAALTIDNVVLTPPSCNDFCDGVIDVQATNATVFSIDNGINSQVSTQFTGVCAGDYQVLISDANGCAASQTINAVNPSAVVAGFDFGPQPTTIFNPNIIFTSTSLNETSHFWIVDINGVEINNEFSPEVAFPNDIPGTYQVCVVSNDANNCVDTLCNEIIIDDEFFIFVPNAFSPNDDGVNDFFYPVIRAFDVNQFELLIFDRWGAQVFNTTSISDHWDGRSKGIPVPNDNYVWKINVFSVADNIKKTFTGHVIVMR